MKWLICSDSHGNHSLMAKAVELEKPDRILHLGDVTRDARRLQEAFPELEIVGVRGNCDPSDGETPEERELFFGLRRVWMLHGHTYWVKSGLGMLTPHPPAGVLSGGQPLGAEPGGHWRGGGAGHLWSH